MLDQGGRVGGWVLKGQDQDPPRKRERGAIWRHRSQPGL